MFCNFNLIDDSTYRCSNCGVTLYSTDGDPPIFICKHSSYKETDEPMPSFVEKLKNFASATVDHIKTGAKMASDKTISERYSVCSSCEFFNEGSCAKCGCPVFAQKRFVSKLSWAEQSCPVGKWGPEST